IDVLGDLIRNAAVQAVRHELIVRVSVLAVLQKSALITELHALSTGDIRCRPAPSERPLKVLPIRAGTVLKVRNVAEVRTFPDRALLGHADQVVVRAAGLRDAAPLTEIRAKPSFEEEFIAERRRPRRLLDALSVAGEVGTNLGPLDVRPRGPALRIGRA